MIKEELTPTEIAILSLIRAKDARGKDFSPIPGRIHLVKELFSLAKTQLGERLVPELAFEAEKFGPFDETVIAALDKLEDAQIVEVASRGANAEIRLTSRGRQLASNLWDRMRGDVRGLISYVKANYNHKSSDAVLEEIYAAFPDYAKYSLSRLANKYKQDGKA